MKKVQFLFDIGQRRLKKMVLTVGKLELEKIVKNFLVHIKKFNKKLDEYNGQTLNKTDGSKDTVELANAMFGVHAAFKKVAGLYKALDFLMWSRRYSDLALWLGVVRENKRLLLQVRRKWADLRKRYSQFYDDWQLGSLIPKCKDCRDYHCNPCPSDLRTPRWQHLS
jgi:hypothetical protein